MLTVKILVGLPASGKSSAAQALLDKHPGKYKLPSEFKLVEDMFTSFPFPKVYVKRF